MLLKDIGGEFSFINRVSFKSTDPSVLVPNGDDAAVFEVGGEIMAISTDTVVENDHFSFDYFTPYQVGKKAIESSVSDIIAIGGKPRFIFISLCLPKDTHIERMEEVYRGISDACKRCSCEVLGGDTTHGLQMIISVTVTGIIASKDRICTRSNAKPGDLIYVTGVLGGSIAGLALLRKKIEGFDKIKKFHLEPECRIDIIDKIAPYATSMIDVSDGLSSEIHHICKSSGVGAIIDESKVPLAQGIEEVAKLFGKSAYLYAYSGGEDFQLVYTISAKDKAHALGFEIGIVTQQDVLIKRNGEISNFENRGYDHFLLD